MAILDDMAKAIRESEAKLAEAEKGLRVLEGAGENAAIQRKEYDDAKLRLDKLKTSLAKVLSGR